MTMDKSLRVRSGMARARSVLTRDERIKRLTDAERWQEGSSPYGLPKVRVYKLTLKTKKKKVKDDEEGADAAKAPAGKASAGKAPAGKAPAAKAPAAKAPAGKAPAAKAPAAKGKK
ncbi:MAG: small basic protein [Planctomycetota bacterium]